MSDLKTIEIKKQIEDKEYKWYVLSVNAGQEELVVKNLQERVKNQGLQDDVIEVWNPTIADIVIKEKKKKNLESTPNSIKVIKQRKLYPGYLFFKSRMNDKIWYVVRNTPGVRLIVGAETKPISLTDEEYQKMYDQVKNSQDLVNKEWDNADYTFAIGDSVKVVDDNLSNYNLTIKSIDYESRTAELTGELIGSSFTTTVPFEKIIPNLTQSS